MLMLPLGGGTPRGLAAPALREPALDRSLVLDLRRLATLDLRVGDREGGPARHADVMLLPLPIGRRELDHTTHRLRLDGRGAARIRLQPGRWCVAVTDGAGSAIATVEVAEVEHLALDLTELPVIRGVLDAEEQLPLQDVRLRVTDLSHAGRPDELTTALRAIGARLNQWLANRAEIRADGAFTLRYLDVPDTVYSVMFDLDPYLGRLRLPSADDPVVVELVHR